MILINWSRRSGSLGIGKWYLMVILLMARLFTQSVQEPSFLGASKAGTAHGLMLGCGIVLSGGLISFIFSRNPSAFSSLVSGGALLALSTLSLKIWRQGKSSFPFILGQAVFTASFFWNSYQTYLLTKNVFPTAIYAALSAAMLCFYLYVVISGGNPPPKKLKPSPSAA
ncbi:protein FATTY ACID EXPORT 1 [Cucumis melo var. makuwa]|uniref:Protein FATTY ACID EXPORT 1 n=1 Tax=Cucumis melo var. makuwa TaxID=1194695 RepID=A0A5A7VMT0_CUCMM|nr:protein FATTY ACID EXPORT 1 [Cucumis melo var. makuwa]TYK14906.1 protein FATTY ACID EXPORT 1 [Cucumis melo var. makuwa]